MGVSNSLALLRLFALMLFHVDVTQGCDVNGACTGPSQGGYGQFQVTCLASNEQGCWTNATPIVAKQVKTPYRPHFTPWKWKPVMGQARKGKGVMFNLTLDAEGLYYGR